MSRLRVLVAIAALLPLVGCETITGIDSDGTTLSAFTPTLSADAGRSGHVAVRLLDNRVLVAGGQNGSMRLASAAIFDPASRSWSAAPSLSVARLGHAAVALADGRVLVLGGHSVEAACGGSAILKSAEIYDPSTGVWSSAAPMNVSRNAPAVVRLADGRVLVAGGGNRCGDVYAHAEIYNPATNSWTMTSAMTVARQAAAAVTLSDGRVLVAGGVGDSRTSWGSLGSAEIYDPATGTWTSTGPMNARRLWGSVDVSAAGALVVLTDGRVLAAGGIDSCWVVCKFVLHSSAEVFNPGTGAWLPVPAMGQARSHHRLSMLETGHVLVAGGLGSSAVLSEAEIFDPASGSFLAVGHLQAGRYDYTATPLDGRSVLLAQGQGAAGALASGEIFAPEAAILALNVAPVAQITGSVTGDEGAELAFSAKGSSDPDGDPLSYAWDFGDGSPAVSGFGASHRYADDGVYTVKLSVSDASHTTVVESSVAVANVAPAVGPVRGVSLLVGEQYAVSGSFADPGADVWSATVDYGDDSGVPELTLNGKSWSLRRAYSVAGVYTVRVVVGDDDGGEGAAEAAVSVLSSEQAIEELLVSSIEQWARDGSVRVWNANALLATLAAATRQLDRGNVTAARQELGAFVNHVEAMMRSGQLSPEQGEQLLMSIQRIMAAIAAA
ncbi:MAG: kelch repeat-containing protein [Gemmatimonadales bacterium]